MVASRAKFANKPVLFLVQAAQAKTIHCEINSGYKSINGGFGTVNSMIIAHAIETHQAIISRTHLMGFSTQSLRI